MGGCLCSFYLRVEGSNFFIAFLVQSHQELDLGW